MLGASLVAKLIKNLPAMQETQVQSLGHEDPLEKGMPIHSSILAWKTLWTEEDLMEKPKWTFWPTQYRESSVAPQWEGLADTSWIKGSRLMSPTWGQQAGVCHQLWRTEDTHQFCGCPIKNAQPASDGGETSEPKLGGHLQIQATTGLYSSTKLW